jgi:cytochrome c2
MRIDIRAGCALVAMVFLLSGCGLSAKPGPPTGGHGDPVRGASAISHYGCGSCHTIARITGAHGLVGPPLSGVGSRLYVAGMLHNTPDNLARWIEHPKSINDRTLMPELGVSAQDATDIAAFLYSLK